MNRTALWAVLLVSLFLQGAAGNPEAKLFVNGQILTMDESRPYAEALLTQGTRIIAVGERKVLEARAPVYTRVIDLQGQTMMPGFVDAHSHFPTPGLVHAGLDLSPPPVGTVDMLAVLLARVKGASEQRRAGSWVIGFNYDNAALNSERHPTRAELDLAAPDHPVYLWHRSGHMGVGNSLALEALGHVDHVGLTQWPAELNVGRDADGRLNGLLQESAAPKLRQLLRQLPLRSLLKAFLLARDEYLAAGVTTLQNGYADRISMHILLWAQRTGLLPQRAVLWPAHDKLEQALIDILPAIETDPDVATWSASGKLSQLIGWSIQDSSKFHVGAIKLVADGSPQGRTAWLTEPYKLLPGEPDAALDTAYRGHPAMPEAEFRAWVERYHAAGLQMAIHGNGDASIDLIIDALAMANEHYKRDDARHIVVHAQTIRRDQLRKLAELSVSVSFFPAHTFFWGDWYRDRLLGEVRAANISPLAAADEFGVKYSIHSDAPVTPMRPMTMLWSATQRKTLSGASLGGSLVVSRARALRAMTIDAAWQNHLETDRGSLEAGKLADLILLSGDPLQEEDVRKLHVQRVWIGGRDVYRRKSADPA
ncbi:amidohydrolase [Granulosicoccus antarcticus]|uniref:N-substituted formamide deformylase n=1 Tax=Granulosicoccus antarcticus IMCC3135 TaxID=1192854 RepID=A0A2Z2NVR4_9GAMM|nr:amidohydrolase [Granulosicoccus antarcticus]ASJ75429.1 N-substituted formamide deformylase [Granulosicoccus antarcticus IMCC3135]